MDTTSLALAAGGLAALGGYGASTLLPIRGLHDWIVPGAIRRVAAPVVALTFDDGPHPERTPELLDRLARLGAKGTFFVVGENIARHPALVRRIAAEGHAIGNHSWSHRWMPGLSRASIEEQLRRCQDALSDALGAPAPKMARPPYGHRDHRYYAAARSLGLSVVLWSIDTLDYAALSARWVHALGARARAHDVVLMHDGNPRARGTLDAVESIARLMKSKGIELGSIAL